MMPRAGRTRLSVWPIETGVQPRSAASRKATAPQDWTFWTWDATETVPPPPRPPSEMPGPATAQDRVVLPPPAPSEMPAKAIVKDRMVSLHVAKGVNFRVAGMRVNTFPGPRCKCQIDHGQVFVTSQRVVFERGRTTRERLFTRLLGDGASSDDHPVISVSRFVSSLWSGASPVVCPCIAVIGVVPTACNRVDQTTGGAG